MVRVRLRFFPANMKFHRLTLLNLVRRLAKVKCECGRLRHHVKLADLRSGHVKSCGCWKSDQSRVQINLNRPKVSPVFKHGGCSIPKLKPLYGVYRRMLSRCYNPNADGYKNWGGRGITVAECWRGERGFLTWLRDLGPRPKGFWLERIDNDGFYSPRNCCWSSPKTQRANQRPSKKAA
jgi:hypothetical protein